MSQTTITDFHGNTGAAGTAPALSNITIPDAYRDRLETALAPHGTDDHVDSAGGDVVNVNVTTSIGRPIDIDQLVADTNWTTHATRSNHGNISFPATPGTIWLYPDGSVVITGNLTASEIVDAVRMLHYRLRSLGVDTDWRPVTVRNVVVQFDSVTGRDRLNLNAVAVGLDDVEYDPAVFSGVIYRDGDGDTCLLFANGETVVQGAGSTSEAVQRRDELVTRLDAYDLLDG